MGLDDRGRANPDTLKPRETRPHTRLRINATLPLVPVLATLRAISIYIVYVGHFILGLTVTRTMKTTLPTVAPFIQTLIDMLQSGAPCLRWGEDGRAFDILDTDVFSATVLPKYFRHSKFTSFQRQLNYFGFRKQSRRHSSICTYAHAQFSIRSAQEAANIKRKNVKETNVLLKRPSHGDMKTRPILAYTEASLAYSLKSIHMQNNPVPPHAGVGSKTEPSDWLFDDIIPLPFERDLDGAQWTDSCGVASTAPFDEEMTKWALSQF
jgi:hypothetical protein